jgi:hypothetical protein
MYACGTLCKWQYYNVMQISVILCIPIHPVYYVKVMLNLLTLKPSYPTFSLSVYLGWAVLARLSGIITHIPQ